MDGKTFNYIGEVDGSSYGCDDNCMYKDSLGGYHCFGPGYVQPYCMDTCPIEATTVNETAISEAVEVVI